MNRLLVIGTLLIFPAMMTGCRNPATVSLDIPSRVEPTPTASTVRRDDDGHLINDDGWKIPSILPRETKTLWSRGKTRNGRTVRIQVVDLVPESPVFADGLPPHGVNDLEWRITKVTELSDKDRRIFCYQYAARPFEKDMQGNGMASITYYRLCDYDGDGKFEFNGSGIGKLVIPDWVK